MIDFKVSQISLITCRQNGIIRTNKKQQKTLELKDWEDNDYGSENASEKMAGAILPGNSSVEMKEFDVPKPGHGQVLIRQRQLRCAAVTSAAFTGNTWEKDLRDIFRAWWQVMNPAV